MVRKLRLLKVLVQPVFVLDDGNALTELPADPIVVSAEEWPTYPSEGFAQAFATLQAEIEGRSPAP
jgi:hypothetical protein